MSCAHVQMAMWEDSIVANIDSAQAARDRVKLFGTPVQAQLNEMHALDYLAYAYLQRGQDEKAREVLDYVNDLPALNWSNGVVAFNEGAVAVRYSLERGKWEEAAALEPLHEAEKTEGNYQTTVSVALRYWARAVGAARSGQIEKASRELSRLAGLVAGLQDHPKVWARHTSEVLRLESTAWLALSKGEKKLALGLMKTAANLEDTTDKSPLSPGRVLPAHEQLADLLLELVRPGERGTAGVPDLASACRWPL